MKEIIDEKKIDFDISCGVPYAAIPLSTVIKLLNILKLFFLFAINYRH
jgi:hypothetical protein